MVSCGNFRWNKLLLNLALVMLIVCAGCATVSIQAERDPNFTGRIGRLYVLVHEGSLGKRYFQHLEGFLNEELRARNISSIVRLKPQLILDETYFLKEIFLFAPDATLEIRPTRVWSSQYGAITDIVWDASLFDRQMKSRIWRAKVTTINVEKLANSIFSRLDQDELLIRTAVPSNQATSSINDINQSLRGTSIPPEADK